MSKTVTFSRFQTQKQQKQQIYKLKNELVDRLLLMLFVWRCIAVSAGIENEGLRSDDDDDDDDHVDHLRKKPH